MSNNGPEALRQPEGLVQKMDKEAHNASLKEVPKEYQEILNKMTREDVQVICDFLLHSGTNSTYINDFIKAHTPSGELTDYQRVLLAPANGIETMVTFLGSLFTKKGWGDVLEGLKNLDETPEVLKSLWYVFYNKLNATQKLAVGIEFAANVIVAARIIALFCRMMKMAYMLASFGPYEANLLKAGSVNWRWIIQEVRGTGTVRVPLANNAFGIKSTAGYGTVPVILEKTTDAANNLENLAEVTPKKQR